MTQSSLVDKAINTIRFLAADAIQKANSGHPGLPMGAAALTYALWADHLKFAGFPSSITPSTRSCQMVT